jgi:formylmethanofuran dehydrogenase subunit E
MCSVSLSARCHTRSHQVPLSSPFSVLLTCVALFIVVPIGAHTHGAKLEPDERCVIVDTDMGLDDVRAILAMLADSTVNIDAFVTGEGSASVGRATDNLIGLLESAETGTIEVLVGSHNPEIDPPPWRQTANTLGGAAFPPPRALTARTAIPRGLKELIETRQGIDYLALGPLGNLHLVEMENPGSLLLINTIWLPARVRDNRITDWNILYDANASQTVFDAAHKVIIIDVSGCDGIDVVSYLSSLEGNSSSVRWIGHLLSDMGRHSGHVMLYDELAAVGFGRRDLLSLADETFSVRMDEEQTFKLVLNRHGNVRVARLVDCDGALATLKNLWEYGPLKHRPAHPEDGLPAEVLLRSFHGHLGPYVVIGYRMGKLALDELQSEGHFGISAEVHSPLKTPSSCLIDGVQIGSGCTLGKRNIKVYEGVEPAWAVFESSNGEKVTIRLRPQIPALVQELVNHKGVEAAGQAFFEMCTDSLFTTDWPGR